MSETTEKECQPVWWKESLAYLLNRLLFDYGIAGTKAQVRYLARLGFAPERIARFYDVVANNYYREHADRARLFPRLRAFSGLPEKYFLYVGRLAPEKNVEGCLRAFAHYRASGGHWALVIVGDGPEREALEKQSEILGISRYVTLAGTKSPQETTFYYGLAGCFVLPSIQEPWGVVVNEAMASGLPVLVSDQCGCAEDLVEYGANGYLFDPRNDEELAFCMFRIGQSGQQTIDAMGRRSREILAAWSPELWAAEISRVLHAGPDVTPPFPPHADAILNSLIY